MGVGITAWKDSRDGRIRENSPKLNRQLYHITLFVLAKIIYRGMHCTKTLCWAIFHWCLPASQENQGNFGQREIKEISQLFS